MVLKSLNEAEKFVRRQQRLGNEVRWDGWDIVFFKADPRGVYDTTDGAWSREQGTYGFENRSPLNDDGTWSIDNRNIKRAGRPRD